MKAFLQDHHYQLIETFSKELFLISNPNTKQFYTLKYLSNPTPTRLSYIKKEAELLKSSKLYQNNLISLFYAESSPSFSASIFEPCTNSFPPLQSFDPLTIFSQICQGVKYLHSHSIILRNLSLNSFLIKANIVKICNFETSEKSESFYFEQSDLDYLEDEWKAPEVRASGNFSKKSDIYSLGLIFYFLIYKEKYQFSIPSSGKQQFLDILRMTLAPCPDRRVNIQGLLGKVMEGQLYRPVLHRSCTWFKICLSSKSTKSIVRSIIESDFRGLENLNIDRLIRKVEANPEKIQKFFREVKKNTENSTQGNRIRGFILLFYYLQKAPIVAYTQTSGVEELLAVMIKRKNVNEENEVFGEVFQGLALLTSLKIDLIRTGSPNLNGKFNVSSLSSIGKELALRTCWYWETLQTFSEMLLSCKSLTEARVIRLVFCEEQVNLYKFLVSLGKGFCFNFDDIIAKAQALFIQDNLEFPGRSNLCFNSSSSAKASNNLDNFSILIKLDDPSASPASKSSFKQKNPKSARIQNNNGKPPISQSKTQKQSKKNNTKLGQNFGKNSSSCKKLIFKSGGEENKEVSQETDERLETIYNTPVQEFYPMDIDSPVSFFQASTVNLKVNQLTFQSSIGSGNSCEVWKGIYKKNFVAIKKQKNYETLNMKEFKRELQIYIFLNHENLVKCIGAVFEKPLCLVLEYCQGGDLFNLLHRRKDINLSWSQRLKILKDISKGMTYLHSRSFIHRDLKSLNLLLTKEISGPTDEIQVKISDFGLSKHYIEGDMMTGQQGTCHWMAPEVLESSNYTLKADVYSFSIVMYEVLTRERPYKDKQPNEISIQVIRQKLRPDLSKISKGCNPALQSLMQLCWDSDSQRRPSFEKISKILETIK